MWVACGISVCSVELAVHYCELPPSPTLTGEYFDLCESPGKTKISTTVTPLGNILQEIAKKSLAQKKKKRQHIRTGECNITECVFSLPVHTGTLH